MTEDDCRSTEYTDARRLFSDGDGRTVIQNLLIWLGNPIIPHKSRYWKIIRSTVLDMSQTESKATRSKFHEESSDNLFIFTTVATHCYGSLKILM